MSNLVIVAIPAEDDYVWKISSEKKPHMTILFLGEMTEESRVGKMAEFLEHAANTSLMRFGMDVDRRGSLGIDDADVLFFSKWGSQQVDQFRGYLLKDNNIRTAYDSAEQFPGWVPHLTLGYPGKPAKEDDRDYPGIHWVNFDKIALWFGDYEGFEFPLKSYDWETMAEPSLGSMLMGEKKVRSLIHYGVKGMRWGKRKSETPASVDSRSAQRAATKLKEKGVHSLSNKELETLKKRINLETNVRELNQKNSKVRLGNDKVKALLALGTTLNMAIAFANSPAAGLVKEAIKR